MSKKVGMVNEDRKKMICHTEKNSKIEQKVRKSYMSNVCQEKGSLNMINLDKVSEIANKTKDIKNQENNIFDISFFNEESILRFYKNLKYLNFE